MTDATHETAFAVDLPIFRGPFRLLAELILDQKVDVCDVPVATVTDRFLAHVADVDSWSLEEATWFLAICAALLELKVIRLMPTHEKLDEEDLLGVSPDLAYARSLELSAFRRVAEGFAARIEEESTRFVRDIGPPREFDHLYPDVMESVDPTKLAALAAGLLRPPPTLDLSHVTPIRYSMAEALTAVQARLGSVGAASFRDERIQVVVRFLALLELFREGKVVLSQAATFGEIDVRWEAA